MDIITTYNLNFIVEDYLNPKILVLTDLSEYPEVPDRPVYAIGLPGFDTHIEINGVYSKSTYVDSNSLGFTNHVSPCDLTDLPDGIYTICYKVCPHDQLFVTNYFFKTAGLQSRFDVFLASIELDYKNNAVFYENEQILNVQLLLDSAKACARLGKSTEAMKRYELSNKAVTRLKSLWHG